MEMRFNICDYPPAGYKVRKVGGGAAWYASKNEAVGLGRDAPPSSDEILQPSIQNYFDGIMLQGRRAAARFGLWLVLSFHYLILAPFPSLALGKFPLNLEVYRCPAGHIITACEENLGSSHKIRRATQAARPVGK